MFFLHFILSIPPSKTLNRDPVQLVLEIFEQDYQHCKYLCSQVLEKLIMGRDNTAPINTQYFKTLQEPSHRSKSLMVINRGTLGFSCDVPT